MTITTTKIILRAALDFFAAAATGKDDIENPQQLYTNTLPLLFDFLAITFKDNELKDAFTLAKTLGELLNKEDALKIVEPRFQASILAAIEKLKMEKELKEFFTLKKEQQDEIKSLVKQFQGKILVIHGDKQSKPMASAEKTNIFNSTLSKWEQNIEKRYNDLLGGSSDVQGSEIKKISSENRQKAICKLLESMHENKMPHDFITCIAGFILDSVAEERKDDLIKYNKYKKNAEYYNHCDLYVMTQGQGSNNVMGKKDRPAYIVTLDASQHTGKMHYFDGKKSAETGISFESKDDIENFFKEGLQIDYKDLSNKEKWPMALTVPQVKYIAFMNTSDEDNDDGNFVSDMQFDLFSMAKLFIALGETEARKKFAAEKAQILQAFLMMILTDISIMRELNKEEISFLFNLFEEKQQAKGSNSFKFLAGLLKKNKWLQKEVIGNNQIVAIITACVESLEQISDKYPEISEEIKNKLIFYLHTKINEAESAKSWLEKRISTLTGKEVKGNQFLEQLELVKNTRPKDLKKIVTSKFTKDMIEEHLAQGEWTEGDASIVRAIQNISDLIKLYKQGTNAATFKRCAIHVMPELPEKGKLKDETYKKSFIITGTMDKVSVYWINGLGVAESCGCAAGTTRGKLFENMNSFMFCKDDKCKDDSFSYLDDDDPVRRTRFEANIIKHGGKIPTIGMRDAANCLTKQLSLLICEAGGKDLDKITKEDKLWLFEQDSLVAKFTNKEIQKLIQNSDFDILEDLADKITSGEPGLNSENIDKIKEAMLRSSSILNKLYEESINSNDAGDKYKDSYKGTELFKELVQTIIKQSKKFPSVVNQEALCGGLKIYLLQKYLNDKEQDREQILNGFLEKAKDCDIKQIIYGKNFTDYYVKAWFCAKLFERMLRQNDQEAPKYMELFCENYNKIIKASYSTSKEQNDLVNLMQKIIRNSKIDHSLAKQIWAQLEDANIGLINQMGEILLGKFINDKNCEQDIVNEIISFYEQRNFFNLQQERQSSDKNEFLIRYILNPDKVGYFYQVMLEKYNDLRNCIDENSKKQAVSCALFLAQCFAEKKNISAEMKEQMVKTMSSEDKALMAIFTTIVHSGRLDEKLFNYYKDYINKISKDQSAKKYMYLATLKGFFDDLMGERKLFDKREDETAAKAVIKALLAVLVNDISTDANEIPYIQYLRVYLDLYVNGSEAKIWKGDEKNLEDNNKNLITAIGVKLLEDKRGMLFKQGEFLQMILEQICDGNVKLSKEGWNGLSAGSEHNYEKVLKKLTGIEVADHDKYAAIVRAIKIKLLSLRQEQQIQNNQSNGSDDGKKDGKKIKIREVWNSTKSMWVDVRGAFEEKEVGALRNFWNTLKFCKGPFLKFSRKVLRHLFIKRATLHEEIGNLAKEFWKDLGDKAQKIINKCHAKRASLTKANERSTEEKSSAAASSRTSGGKRKGFLTWITNLFAARKAASVAQNEQVTVENFCEKINKTEARYSKLHPYDSTDEIQKALHEEGDQPNRAKIISDSLGNNNNPTCQKSDEGLTGGGDTPKKMVVQC